MQCDRSIALDGFFRMITGEPTVIALIGSGCSPATEPTAEVSHYYNITQVSVIIRRDSQGTIFLK